MSKQVAEFNSSILDRIPDAALIYSDGQIVHFNTEALGAFGAKEAEQLISEDPISLDDKTAQRLLSQQMEQSQGYTEPYEFLASCTRSDGTKFKGEFRASPVVWNGLPSCLAVFRVISSAANGIHDPHLLLTAIEAAMDGIAIHDAEGRFIYLNEAHAKNFGYDDPGELIGKSWEVLYEPDQIQFVADEAMSALQSVGHWHGEPVALHRDGHLFDEEISLTALPDGGLICVCRDISERKATIRELEISRERAEQASQAKTRFLATMSHEIRTPMNAVLGTANLLARTDLTNEQREFVDILADSGTNLLELLNDILDASKIEAEGIDLEMQPFSLTDLVRGIETQWAQLAQEKGLSFSVENHVDANTILLSDRTRIAQILNNLVSNAIKFTPQGTVALLVKENSRDDKTANLIFEVEDTGIGLSEDDKKIIFSPFTQADGSTTRLYGGTGLGLSIGSELVRILGGEMGVESELGEGSRFWFTLDLKVAEHNALSTGVANPPPTYEIGLQQEYPLRLLVAEDHPLNQKIIDGMLASVNCELDFVENGDEAVTAVMKSEYDLVLMDIQMPKMDGVAAAKKIRSLPAPKGQIPIIAVTANAMPEDRTNYLQAGMTDYLAKPIDSDELYATISRVVGDGIDDRQKTTSRPSG